MELLSALRAHGIVDYSISISTSNGLLWESSLSIHLSRSWHGTAFGKGASWEEAMADLYRQFLEMIDSKAWTITERQP